MTGPSSDRGSPATPARAARSRRADVPDLTCEIAAGREQGRLVCGIDEAGRGPLAGPVLAAAVILPFGPLPRELVGIIRDSKQLGRAARETAAPLIRAHARVGIGRAEVAEIDRLNILQASLLAMARAVADLGVPPDMALVDGRQLPALPCPTQAVVGGDRRCLSIAAASIIAKVERDRLMVRLAAEYPGYGWEHNMGYPTRAHRAALERLGITPHHRRSFAPVSQRIALSD